MRSPRRTVPLPSLFLLLQELLWAVAVVGLGSNAHSAGGGCRYPGRMGALGMWAWGWGQAIRSLASSPIAALVLLLAPSHG